MLRQRHTDVIGMEDIAMEPNMLYQWEGSMGHPSEMDTNIDEGVYSLAGKS